MFAPPLWRCLPYPLAQPFDRAFQKGTDKGKGAIFGQPFSVCLVGRVCTAIYTRTSELRENPKNGQVGTGRIVEAERSKTFRKTKNN